MLIKLTFAKRLKNKDIREFTGKTRKTTLNVLKLMLNVPKLKVIVPL